MSLYEDIGEANIVQAITSFYQAAFQDPIIGHFFFNHDIEDITRKQIDFAIGMLGGPGRYQGKPLVKAHGALNIRPPHFGRRQVLMKQTALKCGISPQLVDEWMKLEEQLRPIILGR